MPLIVGNCACAQRSGRNPERLVLLPVTLPASGLPSQSRPQRSLLATVAGATRAQLTAGAFVLAAVATVYVCNAQLNRSRRRAVSEMRPDEPSTRNH
jgi:hypothetical protein